MHFAFPWLAVAIFIPLGGAIWIRSLDNPLVARRRALFVCIATLIFAIGGAGTFLRFPDVIADAPWNVFTTWLGEPAFVIDSFNLPLLPLAAVLFVLTALASLHTRGQGFAYDQMLISESLLLAILSCKNPWMLIALLSIQAIMPGLELRALKKSATVYLLHMGLFVACLVAGQAMITLHGSTSHPPTAAIGLLTAAVLIRSGMFPMHCWLTDLFENAALRTALLFVTPMTGAYAAVRLVIPIAPEWAMTAITFLASFTTIYAAGMALVQRDARRFACYLFLSHSSLVLIGLGTYSPLAITGALCLWISVGLSLTGFGLTLRAVEARMGRLSLTDFHGLYQQFPNLAVLFLLTGLASIGFPGTVGFVGNELLVDGAINQSPFVGIVLVIATALNGLAVLHVYFRIFTGRRRTINPELANQPMEKLAVILFVGLIVGGGLYPQPAVVSRFAAAEDIVHDRIHNTGIKPIEHGPASHSETNEHSSQEHADVSG